MKQTFGATPETDDVVGARVMATLRCECGSSDLMSAAPGHEGYRVNLLGESDEGPGRTFAIEPDRIARGWCVDCWPWSSNKRGSHNAA